MSDRSDQGEPTMEEILASIRKIISEDDPESEASAGDERPTSLEEPASDDVLELTERIEDELATPAAPAAPPSPPEPADTAAADDAEIDAILASVTGAEVAAKAEFDAAAAAAADEESIVSSETERAVTTALSEFAGALIEQNKDQEGPIGGNQSLDTLVRSAIEPYLKSWLDEHLEALVERVLKEELGRMARRAENL